MTYFDQVASRRADGIILLTGVLPAGAEPAAAKLPPLVVAAESLKNSTLPTVASIMPAAPKKRSAISSRLGHSRIAHIAGPDHVLSSRARTNGYRKALRAARLAFDESTGAARRFLAGVGREDDARPAADRSRPHGGVLRQRRDGDRRPAHAAPAGLKVPEDVSVVGFDDQQFAELYDPPLTTVHIPRFDIGYQAMMTLRDILSQQRPARSTTSRHPAGCSAATSAPPKKR